LQKTLVDKDSKAAKKRMWICIGIAIGAGLALAACVALTILSCGVAAPATVAAGVEVSVTAVGAISTAGKLNPLPRPPSPLPRFLFVFDT
jgi:hypothetical protein